MEPMSLGTDQPIGPEQTPPPADQSAQMGEVGEVGQTEQVEAPATDVGSAPAAQQTEGEASGEASG